MSVLATGREGGSEAEIERERGGGGGGQDTDIYREGKRLTISC